MGSLSKFTVQQIQECYDLEADKYGAFGTSTIKDARTRKLEIEAIASYLKPGISILEIGCGNGYVAAELVKRFPVNITAFDFSQPLLSHSQHHDLTGAKGTVRFRVGDVLYMNASNQFDLAYSIRCIQNLTNWDSQQIAIRNIVRSLKIGGEYLMHEGFRNGLINLNEARHELGLSPIEEPWHNNFFDENDTIHWFEELGCVHVETNPFMSGYYFGSRVLLPALAKDKAVHSSSRLNDYFCALPPAGDFCPMKIMRFRKVSEQIFSPFAVQTNG